MWLIDKLADKHITDAIENGELDNLPGAGKPLVLDDDSMVPEELRAGYRLLKNAGFLPPELNLRNEIVSAEQLLSEVLIHDQNGKKTEKLNRRMQLLQLRLNSVRGDSRIWHEAYYARKLHDKTVKQL